LRLSAAARRQRFPIPCQAARFIGRMRVSVGVTVLGTVPLPLSCPVPGWPRQARLEGAALKEWYSGRRRGSPNPSHAMLLIYVHERRLPKVVGLAGRPARLPGPGHDVTVRPMIPAPGSARSGRSLLRVQGRTLSTGSCLRALATLRPGFRCTLQVFIARPRERCTEQCNLQNKEGQ
jgi:hypothetical protein